MRSLASSNEHACDTKSGYKQEKCNVWKTLKRWFSFYEIKEPASQGG